LEFCKSHEDDTDDYDDGGALWTPIVLFVHLARGRVRFDGKMRHHKEIVTQYERENEERICDQNHVFKTSNHGLPCKVL
jgi:hypothetical protein